MNLIFVPLANYIDNKTAPVGYFLISGPLDFKSSSVIIVWNEPYPNSYSTFALIFATKSGFWSSMKIIIDFC